MIEGSATGGDGAESSGGGGSKGGSKLIMHPDGEFSFEVDLTPGETTVVSLKKLLRDHAAEIAVGASSASRPNGVPGGHFPDLNAPTASSAGNAAPSPSLEARIAPSLGPVGENAWNDSAKLPCNRLNTVIKNIERLYAKAGCDEENLNDVVSGDDEYDTEDSFIDDSDLNDYFQVDNSATKRTWSTVIALSNVHGEDGKLYKKVNPYRIAYRKKHSDSKTIEKHSLRVTNCDEMLPRKDSDWKKHGTHLVNSHGSRIKEGSVVFDASKQKLEEKKLHLQANHKEVYSINNLSTVIDQSTQQKEKASVKERSEPAVFAIGSSNVNIPHIPKKEGASARARSTLLEKAINDLEKLVAESRPPSAVIQDTKTSSHAIKRRMPQPVKKKLAKVARYAQSSHGKIAKEVVDRLMSIVGHLVQLRTLKRNLKIMVNTVLSGKQEKESRVQLVMKEVADMVTARIPLIKSKALEKQVGTSDDFGEISAAEKQALKRKFRMDDILEDKICNLYDLYVDGLEEDVGPQVRELYAELIALWPNGYMDIHGIKQAIRRGKARKNASSSCQKDPEELERKKTLPRKSKAAQEETNSLAQPVYQQQCVSEPSDHGKILVNKSASSKSVADIAARMPVPS